MPLGTLSLQASSISVPKGMRLWEPEMLLHAGPANRY